jgi:glutamine amidotransferase
MIVIVDYGCGNLGSIRNMLKKTGFDSVISSDEEIISKASKLILPGVGAFDTGINSLKERGLWDILNKKALIEKIPVLGICLGMQLMTNGSEEGKEKGLNWFDADTLRFQPEMNGEKFKIPNIGWNYIQIKKQHIVFDEMFEDPKFYFVHSYFIRCNRGEDILATAEYGVNYTCGFSKDNLIGVQFHPEKSHKFGMRLLSNFAKL